MADDDGWETIPKKKKERKRDTSPKLGLPWVSHIPPSATNTSFQPFMLIICGIPGSGKSTLAHSLQLAMPYKYVRINQDDLGGNRHRCETMARETLANRQCPVIDRCNFDKSQRATFIAIAQKFDAPVDCIVLTGGGDDFVEECIRRCQQRRNHPTLQANESRGVVIGMAQQMHPPTSQEGIRHVRNVTDSNIFNDTIVEYLN